MILHGKFNKLLPVEPVVIKSFPDHEFLCMINVEDGHVYFTKGWSYIRKHLSLTRKHLIVFEMINDVTFHMSLFLKNQLTPPPDMWVYDVKKEYDEDVNDDEDIIIISDDNSQEEDLATPMDVDAEEDVGVPVVFIVDNHFVSLTSLFPFILIHVNIFFINMPYIVIFVEDEEVMGD